MTMAATTAKDQAASAERGAIAVEPDPAFHRFGADLSFRTCSAKPGDHHAVHQLLLALQQRPTAAEFQIQLEHPEYFPLHRVLVKHGSQLVGHVLLNHRQMRCGDAIRPVAILSDFAVAPEYLAAGCGGELLAAAERSLIADGAVAAGMRTRRPRCFDAHGWIECGRYCWSAAIVEELLAVLRDLDDRDRDPLMLADVPPLTVRVWRHVELDALLRLDQAQHSDAAGSVVRSEDVWRWLIGRHGYDRIYVAIDGPDRMDFREDASPIVGYAVLRGDRVLELAATGERAARQLLSRAGMDAIENGARRIRLDAAPNHPAHAWFRQAKGEFSWSESDGQETRIAKLFDPWKLFEQQSPLIARRAREAGIRSAELGFILDGEKFQLRIHRNQAALRRENSGRNYLAGRLAVLTPLLLGQACPCELIAAGRLTASTKTVMALASILFPVHPAWRPPFDEQCQ